MNWQPQPGSLLEAALFFAGVFVGFAVPIHVEVRGLSALEQARFFAGWGITWGIAQWLMPAAFGSVQRRQVRRDILYWRPASVLGPFLGGIVSSLLLFGIGRAEFLYQWFQWLPGPLLVSSLVWVIPFGISRFFWRSEPP